MLTGDLVRLRPLETSDLDRYVTWMNDPDVTRFLAGPARYPFSRADEEEWLTAAMRRTKPPEITLAIETSAESRHIGTVSLHAVSAEERKAGFGIMIGDKESWSHGFGTDAILALLRFAFDEMNLNRIYLDVDEDNARAIACYRKCGFVEEGRKLQDRFLGGRYTDTILMAVLAAEFRALHGAAEASS